MSIHPTSDVKTTKIGSSTVVWQFCVILEGAVIGNNCNINYNVFIENDVVIGNNVTLKSGVQIWDGISLDDDVFIGPNVTFTNDVYPRSKAYLDKYNRIKVCKGASVGANATIIAGVTVGEYALIGAGSVVTKNIPAFTVWYGNPAVQKGFITKDALVLGFDLKDTEGNLYEFIGNDLVRVK